MAGDWIPIDTRIVRKRQVLRMASVMKVTPHHIVGLLVDVWSWAQENSVDGNVDVHVDALAPHVDGGNELLQAMQQVGWLEVTETGVLFPNAEEWITKGAKARLEKNLRQKKWRHGRTNVDAHVDAPASTKAPTTEQNSTDKKERERDATRFQPPTQAEAREYATSIGMSQDDADHYHDHHVAGGWRIGNKAMRDWRAAMRTWRRNAKRFSSNGYRSGTQVDHGAELRRRLEESDARKAQQQ
jgi:hypothetical protein